MGTTQR